MNWMALVFRLVTGLTKLIVEELEQHNETKAAGYVQTSMAFGLKLFEKLSNGEDLEELLNKRAKDLMTEENESEVSTEKAVERAKGMFGRN